MSLEAIATLFISIVSVSIAIYSARSSASKTSVEGLSHLIDRLEKRLEEEIERGDKLERKNKLYMHYINMLLEQLTSNKIKPVDMPQEDELTVPRTGD